MPPNLLVRFFLIASTSNVDDNWNLLLGIREDADWVDAVGVDAVGVDAVRVDMVEVDFVGDEIDFEVNAEVDFVVAIDLDADFDAEADAEVEADVGVETGVDDVTVASGTCSLLLLLFFLDFFVLRGFV